MTKDVAVFGAAGSVGTRVTNALNDDPDYWVLYMKARNGPKQLINDPCDVKNARS